MIRIHAIRTFFISILILISFIGTSQNITVSGEVSGIWDADTVKVISDLEIPAGASLQIFPSTVIECQGPFKFEVHGTVTAQGTTGEPIIFTIIDTVEMSNPDTPRGGWKGFQISELSASDSVTFEHCNFLFGKAWDIATDACGGLFQISNSSRIQFRKCFFGHSVAEYMGGAFYIDGSDVAFEQCTFLENRAGIDSVGYGGILVSVGGKIMLNRCTAENNRANGLGGAMCIWFPEESLVTNCVFEGNKGSTGGGIFFLNSNNTIFYNNLFSNNTGSFFGGALGLKNTSFPILNCTFADNFGGQGGSIYCSSGVSNPVYNTVISKNNAYGNGQQVYIAYLESTLSFYHCAVESGREGFGGSGGWYPGAYHGEYVDNIEEPVDFVPYGDFLYGIAPPSPSIDSGYTDTISSIIPVTDIAGRPRIFNGIIDMGCLEYEDQSGICESKKNKQTEIYPNPFHSTTTITFEELPEKTVLQIFNSGGKSVRTINNNYCKSVTWDGCDDSGNKLPSGLYFITNSEGLSGKVFKL